MNIQFKQKWESQVKKGVLSYIAIKLLVNNELYGYELIDSIKRHTDIDIAEGTLYPLMNRLKKEEIVDSKWVEQETGIPRKYYHLTKTGIKTLKEMDTYWNDLTNSIKKINND